MAGPAIRRSGQVLAVLLALALAAILAVAVWGEWRMRRAMARFEAVLGPPDPARFLRPELAESDNAAVWLIRGARAVSLSDAQRDFLGPREQGDAGWDAAELALAARIIEDNDGALELLRRATRCTESSYGIDYRQGPGVEPQQLIDLLGASSVLWVDARLALVKGDTDRLRIDLATLDRLAESLAGESLLVAVLVSNAMDRAYLDLVHRLVTRGGEGREVLADVEAALAGRDRGADYLRSLAAEGAMLFSVSPERLRMAGGAEPPSWLQAQLERLAMPLMSSALLDEYSALGELVGEPWPKVEAASERRVERGFPGSFAAILYPNLIDSIAKLKAGESAGLLALEAVRQRRAFLAGGAYRVGGEAPLVDPYSGGEVSVEHLPGGRLLLAAPGALELWRARGSVQARIGDPHFVWELPAAP